MGEGRGFYYHFVSFPGLGWSTLCRLFLYLKVKILSFFIRTGNLRTRGQVEHSGLAQMPAVTQVCCAPATWGCTNAHLRGLQASYRSPAPLWILPGNCCYLNMKLEAQCPHRPLSSPWTHRSLSSGEDGSKSPGPKIHEAQSGPLASICPRPPSKPPARSTHCSQPSSAPLGPRRVWWEQLPLALQF